MSGGLFCVGGCAAVSRLCNHGVVHWMACVQRGYSYTAQRVSVQNAHSHSCHSQACGTAKQAIRASQQAQATLHFARARRSLSLCRVSQAAT